LTTFFVFVFKDFENFAKDPR